MLSIVVPLFNSLFYTEKMLKTLVEYTRAPYEVIFVDDFSTDGTRNWLEKMDKEFPFPHTIILNPENLGISKSWNIGVKAAKGEYVCIINNDILLSPDWNVPLINALDIDPNTWVVSPYRTMADHEPQDFPAGSDRNRNHMNVLGCCFMSKRSLYDTIGFFPEELKLWYGDNWLNDIVEIKHKKLVVQVRDSYVHHYISKSANVGAISTFHEIIAEDQRRYNRIRQDFY